MDARIRNFVGRVGERGVRVDRHTPWGNPFIIGKDGNRSEVIKTYVRYLASNEDLMSRIEELRGKRLLCHCKPQRCHAEVLALVANELRTIDELVELVNE